MNSSIIYQNSRLSAFAYGIWTVNPYIVGAALSTEAAQRLATRSLTDPKFQGIMIKGLNAIQKDSPKMLQRATTAMEQYLQEEGFLDEEDEDFVEF